MKKSLFLLLMSCAASTFASHVLHIDNKTNQPMWLRQHKKDPVSIEPFSQKKIRIRNNHNHHLRLRTRGDHQTRGGKTFYISPRAKQAKLQWVWDKYKSHISCETL